MALNQNGQNELFGTFWKFESRKTRDLLTASKLPGGTVWANHLFTHSFFFSFMLLFILSKIKHSALYLIIVHV